MFGEYGPSISEFENKDIQKPFNPDEWSSEEEKRINALGSILSDGGALDDNQLTEYRTLQGKRDAIYRKPLSRDDELRKLELEGFQTHRKQGDGPENFTNEMSFELQWLTNRARRNKKAS